MGLSDSFVTGQVDLLERIARGAPLTETLEGIVLLIEAQTSGLIASILLVDQEQQCVRHGAAPSLPASYVSLLDGLAIGPTAGSCGAAAALGTCVIVEDIATHPNWIDYRHLALPHGLRACWSSPIFSPDRIVLGTFAMYYRETRGPTEAERHWVDAATHLASIAILRHRSEQALRRSEARTQLIFSSVTDAIFYLSVEAAGQFRYVSVNPAFHAATGLSDEQVIGKLVDEVVAPPLLARMLAKFDEAIRSGQPVSWDEVWAYQSGERHGEATVTPIVDEGGRCTNLLCTVHDVTTRVRAEAERRTLEVQLHQAQRMQSLGTLAGGIAHDFNNILTAITGYADLAQDDLPPEAPAHESVLAIRKASERASEVVRQILTFSRQDAPARRPVALHEIIDETITLLRATLPGSVRIRTHIGAATPFVLADATQVHQALMNLGTNAAHAVDGKGTIDVRLETVLVDSHAVATLPDLAEGRYAVLSFIDTGRGMDQMTRARVFEPFFTTKGPGQGTGLGMSVVHGIMRSHRGTVTVDSELGQGATFRLYFPALEAPTEELPVSVAEIAVGHNQHVLYVDDEEALVFLMSRLLRRLGYRVSGYTDPAVALQAFRASPREFDALMTDTSMPGISGIDLVREILRVRQDIPVVMLSGYMQPSDLESARHLGVTEVVLKPHTPRDLCAALQRVLGTV